MLHLQCYLRNTCNISFDENLADLYFDINLSCHKYHEKVYPDHTLF